MNKIFNYKLLTAIQVLVVLLFVLLLLQLNILPNLYIIGIVIVLALIHIVLFFGNKKRNAVTKVISILLSLCLLISIPFINKGKNVIDEITEVKDEVSIISLMVLKDSEYKHGLDLKGKKVQINTKYNVVAMGAAMNQLNELISCDYRSEDDFIKMAANLYDGDVDAILVNEAYVWMMEHKYDTFEDDTNVIWTYVYKKEKEDIKKPVIIREETFNVFISGIDARGLVSTVSRSDVNMLATVNMTTNQILLISIPRDYYVYVSELKSKDKLTHAGLNGINSSVSTIEDLMNIDINYYARVNFTSLIRMVDALGGIEVNVPYSINYGGIYSVNEGVNFMDGEKALWFSRHRETLTNGDEDRIKNQQRVIQGMLNKLISPAIITNYMDILDSVAGSFETNMSSKEITDLLKNQLKTMKSWDVQSYSLTGTGSYFKGGAMMPDTELYYCIPNEQSIQKATDYINQMMDGEFIIVE